MKANASNPAVKLLLYVAATLVLGAVLAPPLFKAGRAAAEMITAFRLAETPPFGYLHKVAIESEFRRYFNRAVLVAALVCLWPAARWLGLRRSDFAIGRSGYRWRDLTVGFVLGAGLLLCLGIALEFAGVYEFKDSIRWGKSLWRATSTATGVALMEEFVFRGALFGLLLRAMPERRALWILSAVFAALHFLKPPDGADLDDASVGWTSGFWLVGQIFRSFGDPIFLLAEFATLFTVGLVLGWTRLKTGSLWLPIGLHGGWVFGIFFFRGLASGSDATKDGDYLPWIGENLKSGLAPLVVIALTGWILSRYLRSRGANDH